MPIAVSGRVRDTSTQELDSQKFYLDPGLDLGRQG